MKSLFLLLFVLTINGEAESKNKFTEEFEKVLCKDKEAGEWFRLVGAEGDGCRDVIQCTNIGLQVFRCSAGLAFDIEKQTCDWKEAVKNCLQENKKRRVKPLLHLGEPLCDNGHLPCGDGTCLERTLFCNGAKDCTDGSDETYC